MHCYVFATGFGERKIDAGEALLTAEASRLGFGRGEVAAGMSNFRSVANIRAPLPVTVRREVQLGYHATTSLSEDDLCATRMVIGAIPSPEGHFPNAAALLSPTAPRRVPPNGS
jgi:hypothetical protein